MGFVSNVPSRLDTLRMRGCSARMENEAVKAITNFIRQRRSIKPVDMDTARGVDRAVLDALFENANWAPTHGLTEPWRFHVFQGNARQQLADEMRRLYQAQTPVAEFRADKMRKLGENPLLAPVVIAIVMQRNGGAKICELEEIEATACAVQNMHLTASAHGLAAYWSTPPLVYSPEFAQWLSIGKEDRCLGLFYIGWPKPGLQWPEGIRKPVAQKIVWRGEDE